MNRRTYKKKKYTGFQKRARVYGPAVSQLARDVAYLGSLVNSEPHYLTTTTSNNFDYNGSVLGLSAVSVGDLVSNRTGNRILPRFLNIKGYISTTTLTSRSDPINFRVIIFRWWGDDTSATPAVPSASDVLATTGSQYAPLSHLNDDVTGSKGDRNRRIEVHKSFDELVVKDVSPMYHQFDCNITLNNPGSAVKEHIQFQSNTSTIPISGGFYILFISDDATSTQLHYKFSSKLVFYDN